MLVVDKDTFDKEVKQADSLVIVDFWNENCTSCIALMPDVEVIEKEFEEKVKFCKLDNTKARRLCIGLRVMGLPAILLFKDGKEIDRVAQGDATKANIENMINKHLS